MRDFKECDQYIEWFIAALKVSNSKESKKKESLKDGSIVESCKACHNEVKKSLESNYRAWPARFDEFRFNSTIVLLSGCPSVNLDPRVSSSEELHSFLKSVPALTEKEAFVVIHTLKNYRFLRGILPWLSVQSISGLTEQYLEVIGKAGLTAVSLAICFELLFALIYTSQHELDFVEAEFKKSLAILVLLYKSKSHSFNSDQEIRMSSYYFLYLLESIAVIVKFIEIGSMEDPETACLGQKFQALVCEKKYFQSGIESILLETCSQLLSLCLNIFPMISVNIWADWHGIKLPGLGLPQSLLVPLNVKSFEITAKDIQTRISHVAFLLKSIFSRNEKLRKIIEQEKLSDVDHFLCSIAVNPNHDPDGDLSTLEIQQILSSGSESIERETKLLNLLIGRDCIFSTSRCLDCVMKLQNKIENGQIMPMIRKLLHCHNENQPVNDQWTQVILQLAQRVSTTDLLQFIKIDLHNGKNNCFKTENFVSELTCVFNQLSESTSIESNSLFVRLCIQDGIEVVKKSVDLVLNSFGLAPIVCIELKAIHFICKSKMPDVEHSLLTFCLLKHLEGPLDDKKSNEFFLFVCGLLELKDPQSLEEHETLPILVSEVVDHLICSRLNSKAGKMPSEIQLILRILESIIERYPDMVVNSSPRFSSLFVCLVLFYNSLSQSASRLALRNCLQGILTSIMFLILKQQSTFEKDTVLIKQVLSRYELSARSLALVSPILTPVYPSEAPVVDKILWSIFFSSNDQSLFVDFKPNQLPHCPPEEWILSLCLILPSSNFDEWTWAFRLTQQFLKSSAKDTREILSTLNVLQEALLLLCAMTCDGKKEDVSITHCFKSFNYALNVYLNEVLSGKGPVAKFDTSVDMFVWWCRSMPGFLCDSELPSIVLSSFCTLVSELVNSKTLVVVRGGFDMNGKSSHPQIDRPTADNENVLDNHISCEEFKSKLDLMVFALVKSLPSTNNMSSAVAGKLKYLLETFS